MKELLDSQIEEKRKRKEEIKKKEKEEQMADALKY
jgi:hypothetical protein